MQLFSSMTRIAAVAMLSNVSACALEDLSDSPDPTLTQTQLDSSDLASLQVSDAAAPSSILALAINGRHPPCAPGGTCVDMHIVAHEDDDMVFMNPDIATSIANGNHVVTVFLTAGSNPASPSDTECDEGPDIYAGTPYASCYDHNYGGFNGDPITSVSQAGEQHFIDRELGALNSYTRMAAPSYAVNDLVNREQILAAWQISEYSLATKQIVQYDLIGGSVSLVFLRIFQTGGGDGVGDLDSLWRGAGVTKTFGCDEYCPFGSHIPLSQQYNSRDELINLLAALMDRFQSVSPGSQLLVNTGDSSWLHTYAPSGPWNGANEVDWVDNTDHVRGAQFAISAFHRYHSLSSNSAPRALREYRGYNISKEPPNVGGAQLLSKEQATYANFIMRGTHADDNNSPNSPQIFPCCYDMYSSRKYASISVASASQLQGRLMGNGSSCLRYDSNVLQMGSCSGAPEWQITTRNEIRLATDPTRCVQLDASEHAYVATCQPTVGAEAQTLVLMSNGQIRTHNADCLSGGSTIAGSTCAGTFSAGIPLRVPAITQNWTLLLSDPVLISSQFGDSSEVDDSRSDYRTITVIDGKICLRQSSGVGCATYSGGTLTPFVLSWFPTQYANPAWNTDSTGGTIMFRHLAATGGLSMCGRSPTGIVCGAASPWTSEFSDAAGWTQPYYYGSLRLADVNGDGNADICGRGFYGITCITGNGSSFNNETLWTSEYSYSAGWNFSQYGETMQYGDIDGDGRDDVCGRGGYGPKCGTASASGGFVSIHNWSMNVDYTSCTPNCGSGYNNIDFGDGDMVETWNTMPGRYRAIRLVDINHDGMVDICGRGGNGIYCALSTGTAFGMKRNVMPFNFGGPIWDQEQYGSTISFGNLDGDSRVDVCLRGIYGMMCSKGP